jgi:hypothetical protein
METISSRLTFIYKFIFTTVWSAGIGVATVEMLASELPVSSELRWLFAATWILGTALIWLTCAPLKRVQTDGVTLLISNYRDEIAVPVSEIATVTQNQWINLRPVTITFENETPFGRAITFMPHTSFRMFSEDEIVLRLRRLARATQ